MIFSIFNIFIGIQPNCALICPVQQAYATFGGVPRRKEIGSFLYTLGVLHEWGLVAKLIYIFFYLDKSPLHLEVKFAYLTGHYTFHWVHYVIAHDAVTEN